MYKYRVASGARTVVGAMKDATSALARGDCTEAIDNLAHAYEARGRVNGFTQALRQQKGRGGISPSDLDKRFEGLLRLKSKIKRACAVSSALAGVRKPRKRRK